MKTLWSLLLLAMVSAAMGGCSDSGNAPILMTGVQGQVYSVSMPGPIPVDWIPPPLETISTVLVLNSNHKVILEVLTDNKGRFASPLDPEIYYLRVKESMIPAETGPYVVKAGELLSVRAHYDNGMR